MIVPEQVDGKGNEKRSLDGSIDTGEWKVLGKPLETGTDVKDIAPVVLGKINDESQLKNAIHAESSETNDMGHKRKISESNTDIDASAVKKPRLETSPPSPSPPTNSATATLQPETLSSTPIACTAPQPIPFVQNLFDNLPRDSEEIDKSSGVAKGDVFLVDGMREKMCICDQVSHPLRNSENVDF